MNHSRIPSRVHLLPSFAGALLAVLFLPAPMGCSSGATGACLQGFVECSGYCVNTAQDFENCGACGQSCGALQSCGGGTCSDSCGVVEVSSKEDLLRLLRGEGWEAVEGELKYAVVSGRIEVAASEVGDGVVFLAGNPSAEGVTLSGPIPSGLDRDNSDYCCLNAYSLPELNADGFGNAAFDGASFTVSSKSYVEESGTGCQERHPGMSCTTVHFSGSMQCTLPWACCCSAEKIDWTFVRLNAEPEACFRSEPCAGFTGGSVSECYEDYGDYLRAQAPEAHLDCLGEKGHVRYGSSCTCEYGWDVVESEKGTCATDGTCHTGPPPQSGPPVRGCVPEY